MKHAYLILAHSDVPLLRALINCLDDSRNDIYVHWDAKSGVIPSINTNNSNLFFLNDRIEVNWAGYSMVKAEYLLFKNAIHNGTYSYFHLLSGVDLPIKSQDYIHQVCDNSGGTEYIAFANASQSEIDFRVQHYFLFPEAFKDAGLFKRILRKGFIKAQDLVGYKRTNIIIKKGSQWCSITRDFVEYLLSKEIEVYKLFDHTFCPDELFIQTICANSPFMKKVNNEDSEFDSNLRYIKWEKGEILPITIEDLPSLKRSDRWFARKFIGKDERLINAIKEMIDD